MILRPALIGIALSAIVVMLLIMPKKMSEPSLDDLPPRLFPMFQEKEEDAFVAPTPLIELSKTPTELEVSPGNTIPFSITLKNISGKRLKNLTLEERFDSTRLTILDSAAGSLTANRLAWQIPLLLPDQYWNVRYTAQVSEDSSPIPLQTTAYVFGEDLKNMTSGSRMLSANLAIIKLPEAGVELGPVMRFLTKLLVSSY